MSVTAAGGPQYDWVRLTYPRGRVDGAYGDGHGWLLPVPSWYFPDRKSVFASLGQVRDEPVIVLMSASGTGKSTVLAQEHQALTEAAACLVDLKTLAGKQDPVAYLSGQTGMPGQMPGDAWHVLLDGFDEALKLVPGLVNLLDQWLGQWSEPGRGRLRLRLATRPGVPENTALEETLRRHWPLDAVVVRDVAPLSHDDVLRAASARGVSDPEGFVAELEQRSLVPAVTLPVPLTILLDRAAEGYRLPETAEEVYRLACEHLCEEPQRPARHRPPGLGLQELMRCAAHMAAILEFCGNGVLTTALVSSPGGPVRLVDVADAIKPEAGGAAEEALSWLTATPLLRSLSEDQWQFANQGIQGFLAASHLKDRRLAPANVQSLLFAGPSRRRYVHPSHQDLAGWLAWHRPEVYGEILDHDPACLLSPDLPAQAPAVRGRVVDALFTAAGHGGELSRLQVLHRANHPGLRSQLAARITPSAARRADAEPQPLTLALALARACPDHAPVGELLDVADDDQANASIRAAAVETVPAAAAVTAAADRLKALANTAVAQVAAAALLALWPQHMPTADLLARMPASAPESYWQRVEFRLRAADADDVVAWMRQQFKDGTVASPAGVMRLLTWACSTLQPAEGEEAQQQATAKLADVLTLLLGSDLAYAVHLIDIRDTWAGNPAWRRLLVGEILARLTAADTAAVTAAQQDQLALLPPEDSIYWARKAAADTAGGLAALGSPLRLPYPGNTPELAELRDECQDSLRLAELTARWFAPLPAWAQNAEQSAAQRSTEIDAELSAWRPSGLTRRRSAAGG